MTTIKSCTDLEQSKTLSKILPLESADMFYADLSVDSKHQYISHYLETYGFKTFEDTKQKESKHLSFLPCWSLAALLNVLPDDCGINKEDGEYVASYLISDECGAYTNDNSVDACVEMIEYLHKQNLL